MAIFALNLMFPLISIAVTQTESLGDADSVSLDAQTMLDMASPEQRSALEDYLLAIAEIDLETQIAVEEYNGAQSRLDALNSDIEQKEMDLEALNRAYSIQTRQLGERAVLFYKEGDLAFINLLLDATSLQNFIQRLNYLSLINLNDLSHRERIGQEKAALQQSLAQLLVDRDEAASLAFELKARKIEIEERNKLRTDALVEENPEMAQLVRAYYTIEELRESRYTADVRYSAGQGATISPDSPAETALTYRGVPYVWGGADKNGFDGPGFVQFVFAQHELALPRSANEQMMVGSAVTSRNSLIAGDVVFFGDPVRHVGIYLGDGFFIHAPNTGDVVKVSQLSDRDDYAGARRYNWAPRTANPQ
jgi:cell wall-associated NlpC family hydrolase